MTIRALALACLLALPAAPAAEDAPPDADPGDDATAATGPVTADLAGCRVPLPAGWSRDAGLSERTVTWRSPCDLEPPGEAAEQAEREAWLAAQAARGAVSIGWSEAEAGVGAADGADAAWERIAAMSADAELLATGALELSGRTWQVRTYRFTVGNAAWTQRALVHLDRGTGRLWCVTASCGSEHWSEWEELFAALEPGFAER